jgi:glycosyltransferase domain-containing protein
MASPRSRYTLLIPTFNRPVALRSLLGYLAARRFDYPVRVLDSSSGDALSQNRETVGRGGLDIVHEGYDPAIDVHKKIELGLASVESTYCSLCADDDVLFTDQLNGLLDVLDANPALAVAHGYYANFKPGEDFEIWHTDYSSPSILADDPLKRIVEQMKNYQAIFYGIHRTGTMKSIRPPLDRVKSLWAKELLTSSLALISGGARRVPAYYLARNSNPSIATEGWHPHQFFATEPAELFREYADYRTVVLEQLAADPQCRAIYRPDQMRRVFDLVHLRYLAPMLSPAIMDGLIEQTLLPDRTARQIIDGMWGCDPPPVDHSDAAGVKRYLARAAAFMNPDYPSIVKWLRRAGGLYKELRSDRKLDVSFTLKPRNMTIRLMSRDGRPRRYVLSKALLNQKLDDGGEITASHLRNIVHNLSDYV